MSVLLLNKNILINLKSSIAEALIPDNCNLSPHFSELALPHVLLPHVVLAVPDRNAGCYVIGQPLADVAPVLRHAVKLASLLKVLLLVEAYIEFSVLDGLVTVGDPIPLHFGVAFGVLA